MFDPKDSKTIGYHLFLLPQGKLFDDLQEVIKNLAEKYQGPVFEPHATLLARIPKANTNELIEKTKQLASQMHPFELQCGKIEATDTYFRSLYCKAEVNAAIEEYHKKALEVFGTEDANTYMPHVSLYYGNVDQSIKDEMIQLLSLPDMKFLVDRIYLYRTEGEADQWIRVGEYMLGE